MIDTLKQHFSRLAAALALCALYSLCGAAGAGPIHVSIDTSSFGTASGYLELQFGASSGGPLATATVTRLGGFGGATVAESWGVENLAGGWRLRNDTANDLLLSVAFSGILSFDLAFDGGHDPSGGYVSPFMIAAFDTDYTPLGGFDPATGALAALLWTPGALPGDAGTVGYALADPRVTVSAVPEPAQLLVFAIGLAAIGVARRHLRGRGV